MFNKNRHSDAIWGWRIWLHDLTMLVTHTEKNTNNYSGVKASQFTGFLLESLFNKVASKFRIASLLGESTGDQRILITKGQ